MSDLVVALVGTDHHPFARFIDWIDDAAVRHPGVRFMVQYGASRAPQVAEGRDYLPHGELVDLMTQARAVVCHGGPGTIMDARHAGHVPICLPRDPSLGEHIDGHQQRFAALVHEAGVVTTAVSAHAFRSVLEKQLLAETLPGAVPGLLAAAATALARERLARELNQLALARPRRVGGRRGAAREPQDG